ncbi:hypothetical protein [Streptomyces sp. CRN 30]|uniref:hypothetical protein n=1 Tax=Streptomyces sp. CRN 30 TaxID=3075613 RepID=UPI0039C4A2AD
MVKRALGAGLVAGLLTGAPAATAATAATAVAVAVAESAAGEVYVALGDSVASGPLIPWPTGPLACGRSTQNYPHPHELAERLDVATFRDVTCGGAKTDHKTQPQGLSLLLRPP